MEDAFQILKLAQDAQWTRRYSADEVKGEYDAAVASLDPNAGDYAEQREKMKHAETTLLGYDRNSPLGAAASHRQGAGGTAMPAQEAQAHYAEALVAAGTDGADFEDWDPRNAWKSFAKMVSIMDDLPEHVQKNCKIDPLQIVVAGDENVGKSQAAQRIIGRQLFAIKNGWCTKVPTKLTFHRSKHQHTMEVKLKGTLIKTGAPITKVKGTVGIQRLTSFYTAMASVVNQWVVEILAEEGLTPPAGQVEDKFPIKGEFCIDIWAPDVPEMILVDLPGLVGMPAGYKVQTAQHAVDYMCDPNTILISVWSSAADALRATKLGEIVDTQFPLNPRLKSRHIAIMTKVDGAAVLLPQNLGGTETFLANPNCHQMIRDNNERLLERMNGTHSDWTDGFVQYFGAGRTWIPMMNKRPFVEAGMLNPLADLTVEDRHLNMCNLPHNAGVPNLPGAVPQTPGVPKYGIRALHQQIDQIVDEQLRSSWKARTLAALEGYKGQLEDYRDSVYSQDYSVAELYDEICKKLRQVVTSTQPSPAPQPFRANYQSFRVARVQRVESDVLTMLDSENGVFAVCNGYWCTCRNLLSGPPGEADNNVENAKKCSDMNDQIAGQLTVEKVREVLQTFADEWVAKVFGTMPQNFEEHLEYKPDVVVQGGGNFGDERKLWRYEQERDRFQQALFAEFDNHADAIRQLLTHTSLAVLRSVDSFPELVNSAMLYVVAKCFDITAADNRVAGWYDANALADEIASVHDARADVGEKMKQIDTAKAAIEALFPARLGDLAPSPAVGHFGGGAAAAAFGGNLFGN